MTEQIEGIGSFSVFFGSMRSRPEGPHINGTRGGPNGIVLVKDVLVLERMLR